jgi:transposase-like protein
MAAFNIVNVSLKCPRCGLTGPVDVECRAGKRSQQHYKLGDTFQWVPGKAVQNGGSPENGKMIAEGYVECPHCKKDYFVEIDIRDDKLREVRPNMTKQPFIK